MIYTVKQLAKLAGVRLEGLLETIDRIMKQLKEGEKMNTDELFASFTDKQMNQYKEELKAKWGKNDTYKQSMERTKQWIYKDFERRKEEGQAITLALAQLMDKGIASTEVQAQIERHFQHINRFYDCSYEMYRNLGKMYSEDRRFAENYNKVAPQLAEFMRDAIAYNCSLHTRE